MDETISIADNFDSLPLRQPRAVAEVGDFVRGVVADNLAIYPFGGRTQLDLGLPPTRAGIAIDLRGLDTVLDYPARDMTVTVQAGITIGALQRLLAGENQRLPIDVPFAETATLGGSLAANVSGSRRYGFGTLRDYVLGMSTVNDAGQEVKAGGRVVKNVAGYDLPKLHIGALGTLGIITQVTLKVRPLPEATALLALGCTSDSLGPLLDRLHGTRTRPVCLDVLNRAAAKTLGRVQLPDAEWIIALGFEDNNLAVGWQVKQVIEEVAPAGILGIEGRAGEASNLLWNALTDLPLRPAARLTFKANLLPQAVAPFCRRVASWPEDVALHAHAGSGIVRGHVGGDLTADRAAVMLKELNELAAAAKGNVVLTQCPAAWKRSLPIWGMARGDAGLMQRVKDALDPRGLFNPGRFLDGM